MEIRILPGNIANMIAAGEVVQRPASVVKELMENAVDAGATRVTVVILDAGGTLIQVIDNGCGMSPDEAVLCFERHATSKISTAEDLNGISTFGFRGEALPSIAAVAEVTLKTRTEDSETGCKVEFAASQHLSTEEAAVPVGTSIAVRNLFYNIPARRKFLKSANVELKHIIEEFTKVALTRPEIEFTLNSNGKDIFSLRKAKSLKYRIMDLMGQGVAEEIVDVSADTSLISLRGYVGKPDSARKTLGKQFFFVNGRYFKSAYMHKAVMRAYEDLSKEGTTPSYFIYLETDPASVDVNVSPTKSEVKFEDDSFVFQVIYAAVKETLGKNSFAADIDFSNPEINDMPVMDNGSLQYRPQSAPKVDLDPDYNPFESGIQTGFDFQEGLETPGQQSGYKKGTGGWSGSGAGFRVDRNEDYGKLFEEQTLQVSQTIILDGKYIITPSRGGLMVVNIRRARERILYDRALAALVRNEHVTQITMFPVKVEVGADGMTLFNDNSAMLESLGFDITPFGTDTIVVNGVPEGYSGEPGKVQTMVSDLMLILSDDTNSLPGMMESAMAEKMALLGASSSEPVTSPAQARLIVDTLLGCSTPDLTSSGKKTMVLMPSTTIEKLF